MSANVTDANSTQTRNTWKDLELLEKNGTDRHQVHHAGFWMDYETHGGEDVPVYSSGKYPSTYPNKSVICLFPF